MKDEFSDIIPASFDEVEMHPFSQKDYILTTKNEHYLKISANVYNILMLVDGKKSIKAIEKEYMAKFEINISSAFIFELLYKKLPIYESAVQTNQRKKPPYLKLSFIIFKKSFLQKITPHFGFLFKRKIAFSIVLSAFVSTPYFRQLLIEHFSFHQPIFCTQEV